MGSAYFQFREDGICWKTGWSLWASFVHNKSSKPFLGDGPKWSNMQRWGWHGTRACLKYLPIFSSLLFFLALNNQNPLKKQSTRFKTKLGLRNCKLNKGSWLILNGIWGTMLSEDTNTLEGLIMEFSSLLIPYWFICENPHIIRATQKLKT